MVADASRKVRDDSSGVSVTCLQQRVCLVEDIHAR